MIRRSAFLLLVMGFHMHCGRLERSLRRSLRGIPAPRILRSLRSFSDAIPLLRGPLVGRRSARRLAARFLTDLAFEVILKRQPRFEARTWVDDMHLRSAGTAAPAISKTALSRPGF